MIGVKGILTCVSKAAGVVVFQLKKYLSTTCPVLINQWIHYYLQYNAYTSLVNITLFNFNFLKSFFPFYHRCQKQNH